MKVAVDTKTGIPVRADGEPAVGERTTPFLHVLPKIWLPYEGLDENKPHAIWLESIEIPELGYENGGEKFVPCRPYPNWNYVVFGADGNRLGFYIPLEENLPSKITLKMYFILTGDFHTDTVSFHLEVFQTQYIQLVGSDIGVDSYSTEDCTPGFLSERDFVRLFEKRRTVTSFGHPILDDEGYLGNEWHIESNEALSPLPNRYVCSSEFENYTPHRNKPQETVLREDNEQHRKNAIVEGPFELLEKAIALASADPTIPDRPEDHPALKQLCHWWNNHPDVSAEFRRAKSCQVLVRANDNDGYQDIDWQVPNVKVRDWSSPQSSARIGDHFLIVFLQGIDACKEDQHGVRTYLVDGDGYEQIWIELDEFALGYETLDNLKYCDARYETIFQHYRNTK